MWRSSLLTGRGLFVLATAAYAALAFAMTALAGQPRVPVDASLTIREYVDLGVPDPTSEWSVNKYERALRALGELPRVQLPRAASSRSQLLFDRLLMSYGRAFDLAYENGTAGETDRDPPLSLPQLYAITPEDGLLFDRELVAIRAETLSRSVETLSTRADLLALAKRFAERIETASSEADRIQLSTRAARAEETAARVSRQIKEQASELLALAGVPEIGDPARQQLLESAQELFPKLTKFLREEDVRWISTLLRGAGSPDFNVAIRPGLLKLAEELQRDGADSKS